MPRHDRVLTDAKVVGYDESGVCVWFGGYGFNVYDPSTWEEIDHFTVGSGVLVKGEASDAVMRDSAIKHMMERGYEVIR